MTHFCVQKHICQEICNNMLRLFENSLHQHQQLALTHGHLCRLGEVSRLRHRYYVRRHTSEPAVCSGVRVCIRACLFLSTCIKLSAIIEFLQDVREHVFVREYLHKVGRHHQFLSGRETICSLLPQVIRMAPQRFTIHFLFFNFFPQRIVP